MLRNQKSILMIGFKRQNVSLLQQKPENKYLKNTFLSRVYLIKLPSSNEEYIEKLSGQKFFNELQRTSTIS